MKINKEEKTNVDALKKMSAIKKCVCFGLPYVCLGENTKQNLALSLVPER